MQNYIKFIFITTVIYAAELDIRIIPDSLYVGSLMSITISVKELRADEYPDFSELVEQSDKYSVVQRILNEHSVEYIIQSWVSGKISIPSIPVNIKKFKKTIEKLESDVIYISVLSNINEDNFTLREIKPLEDIKFMKGYKIILYTLLIIIGLLLSVYFWKNRKKKQPLEDGKSTFAKSIFQETIHKLQLLEMPTNINRQTTEEYYIELSQICRSYIKHEYFIRATEMTSEELMIYFESIGINHDLINNLSHANKMVDIAKYARQIPNIEQFKKDKEDFINIIKSFQKYQTILTV